MDGLHEYYGNELRLYCPTEDVSQIVSPAQELGFLDQASAWLEQQLPTYGGEPIVDVSLAGSVGVSDLSGYLGAALNEKSEVTVSMQVPLGLASITESITMKDGEVVDQAFRYESEGIYVEQTLKGRTTAGYVADLGLWGLDEPYLKQLASAEVGMYSEMGHVGLVTATRLGPLYGSGEAALGWGRGAELLAARAYAELLHQYWITIGGDWRL